MKIHKIITVLAMTLFAVCSSASADVKVAVVRSWGSVPVFEELNNNWAAYGTIPLTIDTSLLQVTSFTYADLTNTGADVLWISDPSGGLQQYSAAEIDAVRQYVSEGHSILGTYLEFQWRGIDNRGLAPIFGLRQDINYTGVSANQVFDILIDHPLFRDIPDPYISSGYPYAEVPADDLSWDAGDFGMAQLLAQTDDKRGVITWYSTGSYYAIFISEMVEYQGNPTDTQLLYNALTITEFPCPLKVDPPTGFVSDGNEGGPFDPSSKIYTLTNSGPNSLIWDVSTTCSWLDLYPSDGNLPADANTTVTVSVNALANNLEVGIYSGEIIFRDLTSDCNVVRNATLEVLIESILELAIPDTARVVDSDDGIYVVGTDGGDLYVINEGGEYTVTALDAGYIHDVRIEDPFIAVAAGSTVIELSLDELTPVELWRNNPEYYSLRSVDLSDDGDYVAYLSYRYVGVIQNGSVVASYYLQGSSGATNWLDATADMQYIAITDEPCPPGPSGTQTGVELFEFDGSSLIRQWGVALMTNYETVEVRVSDAKDYVAAATSSGTFIKVLDMNDGSLVCEYETPGQEQFACDGDDNLNYVIGATQAWSPPYSWFILRTEDCCEVVAGGDMTGPINDLDSTPDASHFAFGSDTGEFILLSRSDDAVDIDFEGNVDMSVEAIEIGDISLLVGGDGFINLYPIEKEAVDIDIKPGSCPNPLNVETKGVLPVAVLGAEDFDVNTIDIASVRLEGVAPIRSSFEDVGAPVIDANDCNCTEDGPDGYTDLTLKFKTQEIVEVLGDVNDGDVLSLGLTGALSDETPIEGADCIVVIGRVPRWMKAKRSDANEDGIIDFRDFCLMAEYWLEVSAE